LTQEELKNLLDELITLPAETEWVEFKGNYYEPQEIGEYISALSNSACLYQKDAGFLVFGIENKTHAVKGTTFKPKKEMVGNEELENWLARLLSPRIDFKIFQFEYEGHQIVIFKIDPTHNTPVRFSGTEYIRVGSYKKKLADFPEKARKIWNSEPLIDWSAQICEGAAIEDLDEEAIAKARKNYKEKYPARATEVDNWNDVAFLNKAKVTIQGKITRTAIILLGKDESEHFINPAVAKITWVLKDENNIEKDYEHFGPPFLINVEAVYTKIRNLKYRYLLNSSLFPTEITKYEPWVIREVLNNCIAHQDYELMGRISVVENPDDLIFTNLGSFIPESVEKVIEQDAPPERYRNLFLANAMVNLNMIDSLGGGIKKMFLLQRNRYFPLPDYDLSDSNKVKARIIGKVIDEKYTKLLINKTDLSLKTVICLDKVQKKIRLSPDNYKLLKAQKLVEGRYPNLFVTARIATITGEKTTYIKHRAFDKKYYKSLIIDFIKEFGSASKQDINRLLFSKLPDILDEEQKKNKINNLLSEMSKKDKVIRNTGSDKKPCWILI